MRFELLAAATMFMSTTALAEQMATQVETGEAVRAPSASSKSKPPPNDTVHDVSGVALIPLAPENIEQAPALRRLAKSGAQLFEAGSSHGLRSIVARRGEEFMIFQMTPDGEAIISGVQTDLSVERLLVIVGQGEPHITELGSIHGLRGLFVRNGRRFQVFYATPDGEKVIPGVMWDSSGKNITREQVAPIPGATPTVTIGREGDAAEPGRSRAVHNSALDAARSSNFGIMGSDAAPRVYIFVDPLCGHSVRALQQLQPFIASHRVQAAIIPLSVLDYENEGRSTRSALAMLSKPADQMAAAWSRGDLDGPASPEADERLRRNMAVAESLGLRGTPTVIWRKADGSEGRVDGLPEDWTAVIASMGAGHAAR
jgi:thiol:disulfide interchange protein DsbG